MGQLPSHIYKELVKPALFTLDSARAHAALEDLRAGTPKDRDWPATQAQAERVLPVAMQVLYVLAAN